MCVYLVSYSPKPSGADSADLEVMLSGAGPEIIPLEAIWSFGW